MNEQTVHDFFRNARDAFAQKLQGFTIDLLDKVRGAQSEKKKQNLLHAEDFNVFDFIAPDENGLSDIIAWMLNPVETHGQGETFLRHFLKVLDIAEPGPLATAKVYREETTTFLLNALRRIDILLDFGLFGVGIENILYDMGIGKVQ